MVGRNKLDTKGLLRLLWNGWQSEKPIQDLPHDRTLLKKNA